MRFPLVTAELPRTGLANCLFVWSQAEVFARERGLTVVRPSWPRWQPGAWLRLERDLRNYAADFVSDRFTPAWLTACWARTSRKSAEHPGLDREPALSVPAGTRLIVFRRGLEWPAPFAPLRTHDDFLGAAIRRTLRPACLRRAEGRPAPQIGLHVRLGDFVPQAAADRVEIGNQRIPLAWYVAMLEKVRAQVGRQVPATVFSDGRDDELRDLLRLPCVRRAERDTAASDLLTLARSKVIIGTSGSTFSLWAAFLGAATTLWYPGGFEYRVSLPSRGGYQGACLPDQALPDELCAVLPGLFPAF